MTELERQLKKLAETRPTAWEYIPDIPLYMDQLVSYMPRQLLDFECGETLTSAMVNNYIKAGLLPRASEKRYGREHIALLTSICVLKHVMSAKEIKELVDGLNAAENVEDCYAGICGSLDREISASLEGIDVNMDRESMYNQALELAVGAYARQLSCKRIMDVLRDDSDKKPQKSRERKENGNG